MTAMPLRMSSEGGKLMPNEHSALAAFLRRQTKAKAAQQAKEPVRVVHDRQRKGWTVTGRGAEAFFVDETTAEAEGARRAGMRLIRSTGSSQTRFERKR
jgi:hypothetical protein